MKQIDESELSFIGTRFSRPESVLCTNKGTIVASDSNGGILVVHATGLQERVIGKSQDCSDRFVPNGIAMQGDGSILFANLGADGGVWRMGEHGQVSPYLRYVDGIALPPTNSVYVDQRGRVWISISTRLIPRDLAFRKDWADGFIVLVDEHGPRIVADGIGYSNECKVDLSGEFLFVNETFGRRLLQYPIRHDNSLGRANVVTEFGLGNFPDGLSFDDDGHVWVVSIVSNRIVRVAPSGEQQVLLEIMDAAFVHEVEQLFETGTLTRNAISRGNELGLGNISSICFGGRDRRDVYLGRLCSGSIVMFRSAVQGQRPPNHCVEPIAFGSP